MTARRILILPAEVEADVLGDDEPFAAGGLIVAVPRIRRLFADEPRCMVAKERFDRDETATDDQQVGLNDTRIGSATHTKAGSISEVHHCDHSHPHGRGDDDPGLIDRGKQREQGGETDDAGDQGATPTQLGSTVFIIIEILTAIPPRTSALIQSFAAMAI